MAAVDLSTPLDKKRIQSKKLQVNQRPLQSEVCLTRQTTIPNPTLMVPQCQRPTTGPAFFPSAPRPFTRPRASSLLSSCTPACLHGDDHELALAPWRLQATALACSSRSPARFSPSCNPFVYQSSTLHPFYIRSVYVTSSLAFTRSKQAIH